MEEFSLEIGIPDGQKLDANGNLWLSGPGGLHVITGEGALLGRILTPENVGNQAWGGEDWKTLFICTSSTVHTLRTTVAGASHADHELRSEGWLISKQSTPGAPS